MNKLMKAEFYKLQKRHSIHMIFFLALTVGMLRGFSSYPGYQIYTIGLIPELFDAVLISVFTAAFLCTEFSNRTFGNAFLCGTLRQNVFFAKLTVYFPGILVLILLPLMVSTSASTMRNGFGADWEAVALEMAAKLLFYIFHRFSMAGFSVLVAVVIQNSIGTLGISVAGIYLMSLTWNSVENPLAQDALIGFIIKTAMFLSAATIIFMKRDLK
ncbi:MAG: ABC transporter permease [Lachnospiraceae bacterium]|nr:ABC transporter permease [Lachnospiraceae bacterium]